MTENVTTTINPARSEKVSTSHEIESVPFRSSSSTYVMRGLKEQGALDIYHLILAPTYACNLRCKHCYLPDHSGKVLPKDIAFSLVDQWRDIVIEERGLFKGIFHVKGGEPLATPYFYELLDYVIKQKSLWFMMTTNGTFIKKKLFDKLERGSDKLRGHLTVIVSVDGASSDTHDYLRGEGRLEETIKFIQELRKRDIQVYLNSVVHKKNIHEISTFLQLAKSLEVAQINFLPMIPRGYGVSMRDEQATHLDIHRALTKVYENGDQEIKVLMSGGLPDIHYKEQNGQFTTCDECVAAYRGLYYIKPDGSVFTCPNLEAPEFALGNAYDQSLHDINEKLNLLHSRCNKLNNRYLCAGEKHKYEITKDQLNINSLNNLQKNLQSDTSVMHSADEVAFCVSRNW